MTVNTDNLHPSAVDLDVFLAVLVTGERVGVLAALTAEAEAHFGHQNLQVRSVSVVPQGLGGAVLATAEFSALPALV